MPAAHHQRQVGEGADRHEGGVPEADLTGMAADQHQAQAGQGPDQHRGQFAEVVGAQQPGRGQQQRDQQGVLGQVPAPFKQVDIVVVATLETVTHEGLHLLLADLGEQAAGAQYQHHQH